MKVACYNQLQRNLYKMMAIINNRNCQVKYKMAQSRLKKLPWEDKLKKKILEKYKLNTSPI